MGDAPVVAIDLASRKNYIHIRSLIWNEKYGLNRERQAEEQALSLSKACKLSSLVRLRLCGAVQRATTPPGEATPGCSM